MLKPSEIAKKTVDQIVNAGLDCGAIMHKTMEAIIEDAIKQREKEVTEFVKGCYEPKD